MPVWNRFHFLASSHDPLPLNRAHLPIWFVLNRGKGLIMSHSFVHYRLRAQRLLDEFNTGTFEFQPLSTIWIPNMTSCFYSAFSLDMVSLREYLPYDAAGSIKPAKNITAPSLVAIRPDISSCRCLDNPSHAWVAGAATCRDQPAPWVHCSTNATENEDFSFGCD